MSADPAPPVLHFVLSPKSILDTLFLHKRSRKPAFSTLTQHAVTTLYRVDDDGHMHPVGQVRWDTRSGAAHDITFHDKQMSSADFLTRPRSILGTSSWLFSEGQATCKWKQTDAHGATFNAEYPGLRVWSCYDLSSSSYPSSSSTHRALMATLSQPQPGMLQAEMTVFASGCEVLDALVFTGVLISAKKGEWRHINSQHTEDALESILTSNAQSSLPAYAPSRLPGTHRRPRSHVRSSYRALTANRPRTADPQASRSGMLNPDVDPPPYTSRAELPLSS